MSPLILTMIVVPVVLLAGTWFTARMLGNTPMRAAAGLWMATAMLVILSVLGGLLIYSWSHKDYDLCINGVDRSFGSRDFQKWKLDRFADIQHELDARYGIHLESIDDIVKRGVVELDKDLPMRTYAECPKPLTF